jgi:hypothetical protein
MPFGFLNHIDTKVHSNTHIDIYVKTYCIYVSEFTLTKEGWFKNSK